MANNYSQFSAQYKLNGREARWVEWYFNTKDLEDLAVVPPEWLRVRGLQNVDLDDCLHDWPNFQYEIERDENGKVTSLCLHDNAYLGWFNVEHVALFLQAFLKKFHPDGYAAFGWADTCDKPLVDAFGGGACFVTAKKITYVNTYDWVAQQAKRFDGRKAARR